MKRILFLITTMAVSFNFNVFAQNNLERFIGEWDNSNANIISILKTKDFKKWIMVNCDRPTYILKKECVAPYQVASKKTFVYNPSLMGLCSLNERIFCFTILKIRKDLESNQDLLIQRIDPFNYEPGSGSIVAIKRFSH